MSTTIATRATIITILTITTTIIPAVIATTVATITATLVTTTTAATTTLATSSPLLTHLSFHPLRGFVNNGNTFAACPFTCRLVVPSRSRGVNAVVVDESSFAT